MSEYEFDNGIECPNCGGSQTEESKTGNDNWFCFLCGTIWNPKEEREE